MAEVDFLKKCRNKIIGKSCVVGFKKMPPKKVSSK